MRNILSALVVAVGLFFVGCVIRTEHRIEAHVTLDIRHIEQQADEVLDYMEGKTDVIPEIAPGTPASRLEQVWDFLSPIRTAYAAEELNTSSARYRQILQKINARSAQINELKSQACVGENNRGYLVLQECAALQDPAKKNEIQRLMAEENEDRKAFYSEIARLNSDQNVTVADVERIYVWKRLERAGSGEMCQLPGDDAAAPDGYKFSDFKAKPLGQRLGAACVPDAWVRIP